MHASTLKLEKTIPVDPPSIEQNQEATEPKNDHQETKNVLQRHINNKGRRRGGGEDGESMELMVWN